MSRSRRLALWLALALVVFSVVAAAVWLRGALSGGTIPSSPIPPPSGTGTSPLPTPASPVDAVPAPHSWGSVDTALTWVALGAVLAMGITFIVLNLHRQDVS